MPRSTTQTDLFQPQLPEGMRYAPNFVSEAEEIELLEAVAGLPLRQAQYKAYTANRRIASFGSGYDFDSNVLTPAPPLPAFLLPLRDKVAGWLDIPAEEFAHALVTEYRPGTALGWHRDVPQFGVVAGISLAGWCRMRLRPYAARNITRADVIALELAPRSAYSLQADARWGLQHSISPTKALRYSITFRTLRTDVQ
jgi:alkylated DNA repair dioxygenase AlkB